MPEFHQASAVALRAAGPTKIWYCFCVAILGCEQSLKEDDLDPPIMGTLPLWVGSLCGDSAIAEGS